MALPVSEPALSEAGAPRRTPAATVPPKESYTAWWIVIILAILAAIVVPQFASSTDDAAAAALRSNLAGIRSAIDLYTQQHGGTFPGAVASTGGTCTGGTAGSGGGSDGNFVAALGVPKGAAGDRLRIETPGGGGWGRDGGANDDALVARLEQ